MDSIFVYRLNKFLSRDNKINIYCIGSNKVIGDMLGPMVGSMLINNLENNNVKVFGHLNEPLTYRKLMYSNIKDKNSIFIDSALGNKYDIGKVIISNRKLMPGKALSKDKICYKGTSIKAIVGENRNNTILNAIELKRVPYEYIRDFAKFISKNIYETIKYNE